MTEKLVSFLNLFVGLRKTIIMLALILISIIFRVKGFITPDNFADIMRNTVIAYMGSNSIEHFSAMVKEQILANGKKVQISEIQTKTTEEG